MDDWTSVKSVLKRGIELEERAAEIYAAAAKTAKDDVVRRELQEIAAEEVAHKDKLEKMLAGDLEIAIGESKSAPVTDVRLTDHLVGGSLEPNASFADVLLFAAKGEKAAYDFYLAMGEKAADARIKDILGVLANEELRHKDRLERIYEDLVYQEF